MAYDYQYPYTDPARYNDDWLLAKMQELDQDLTSLEERVKAAAIEASKEYVDSKLSGVYSDFAKLELEVTNLRSYFDQRVADLQNNYTSFTTQTQAQIDLMTQRINAFRDELSASIIGVNARTDLAIEQNNEYILEELSKGFSSLRVINYFTGEQVTIQNMLNYLAQLHATDGIDYTTMAGRNKTYTEYAALNITYTQLAEHGNSLFV